MWVDVMVVWSGSSTWIGLLAGWTLRRLASKAKKWPVLPVSMIADDDDGGEEPGAVLEYSFFRVLWLQHGADSALLLLGVPPSQLWPERGRRLRSPRLRTIWLLPPRMLSRVALF